MCTVSTGGSTKDASIGFYHNPLIELIIIVFMVLGGTTLILYVKTMEWRYKNSASVSCFFLISLIGGCTGSTTGGIKIFRFQVLYALTKSHLLQLRRPHGVYVPVYQDYKISDSVAFSVFTFITLYCFCLVILALALSAMGIDFMTSLSGAATCISNVGPGLGELIGPHTSFAVLRDGRKLVMIAGMILGRLELLKIIVLFIPSFWRD